MDFEGSLGRRANGRGYWCTFTQNVKRMVVRVATLTGNDDLKLSKDSRDGCWTLQLHGLCRIGPLLEAIYPYMMHPERVKRAEMILTEWRSRG